MIFFLAFCSRLNLKCKNIYEEHLKRPFVVFKASLFCLYILFRGLFPLRSQLKGQKVS